MAEEIIMYEQLQKICRLKLCFMKFFGQIWGISSKIFFALPENCLSLDLWGIDTRAWPNLKILFWSLLLHTLQQNLFIYHLLIQTI